MRFQRLRRSVMNIFLAFVLLAFTGCSTIIPASVWYVVAGTTVASLMLAQKLPTDVASDLDTGLDCDLVRSLREQTEYCQIPENLREVNIRRSYCYRSLGSISCYSQPNPYLDNTSEVGTTYQPDASNESGFN